MKFSSLLKIFGKKEYQHLVTIKIYRNRLIQNLEVLRKTAAPAMVAPVLKSNAYGHGLVTIAKILKEQQVPFLAVDSLFEAGSLRQEKIKTKILVLGFTPTHNILYIRLPDVSFAISSLEQLLELSTLLNFPLNIHLKFDTGMHRQGLRPEQVAEAFRLLQKNVNLQLEGVCSHLADADGKDDSYTLEQIKVWNKLVGKVKQIYPNLQFWHLAATEGLKFNEKIDQNVSRVGLGLYGINNSGLDLRPVLEFSTVVSAVKPLLKSESIGYNLTYTAPKDLKVAVLSAGYFEGVDRRLSNLAKVKIRDQYCPIIGRVSMNITTIDVSAIPDVKAGESAIIFSSEKGDENSVENLAKLCQTIPYELLIHLSPELFRVVV